MHFGSSAASWGSGGAGADREVPVSWKRELQPGPQAFPPLPHAPTGHLPSPDLTASHPGPHTATVSHRRYYNLLAVTKIQWPGGEGGSCVNTKQTQPAASRSAGPTREPPRSWSLVTALISFHLLCSTPAQLASFLFLRQSWHLATPGRLHWWSRLPRQPHGLHTALRCLHLLGVSSQTISGPAVGHCREQGAHVFPP